VTPRSSGSRAAVSGVSVARQVAPERFRPSQPLPPSGGNGR